VKGVYGNPPVQFHLDHQPETPVIDFGNDYSYVLTDSFPYSDYENNLLQLTTSIAVDGCPEVVPGAPEAGYFGTTTNDQGDVEYWIHSTSFLLQTNTFEQPLLDGGKSAVNQTKLAPYNRQRAVCSNAPRSFLNEDYCVLSNDACYQQQSGDTDIEINEATLRQFHFATGNGTAGTDTKYGMFSKVPTHIVNTKNFPSNSQSFLY
jgi:hypothetical protein